MNLQEALRSLLETACKTMLSYLAAICISVCRELRIHASVILGGLDLRQEPSLELHVLQNPQPFSCLC